MNCTGRLSAQLAAYVVGPESWDTLHPDDRKAFLKAFQESVGRSAAERYEELFRRLAADFPEVAFWANLVDHQATRGAIRDLRAGLAGLERVLTGITTGRAADERRDALARSYRAALDQRVLETGEVPAEGLRIPALGEAYINPDFRVAEVGPRDSPHLEQWWDDHPVRDDFQAFPAGLSHLTAGHHESFGPARAARIREVGPDQGPRRSPAGARVPHRPGGAARGSVRHRPAKPDRVRHPGRDPRKPDLARPGVHGR